MVAPAHGLDSAPELDASVSAGALAVDGSARDAAVLGLRAFLVAVGWFEFSRRREQLDACLVRDSAETACVGVLTRLGDYRGQSRFASGSRSSPSTKPRRPPGRSRQADVRPRPPATNPPATCAGRDKVRGGFAGWKTSG